MGVKMGVKMNSRCRGQARAGHRAQRARQRRRRQHRRQRQRERERQRRATAFEQHHTQRIGPGAGQADAQRRRAGALPGFIAAQQKGRAGVPLRRQLQAAQRIGRQPCRQPGQHGAEVAALERVLQRPQHIGRRQALARSAFQVLPRPPSRARRARAFASRQAVRSGQPGARAQHHHQLPQVDPQCRQGPGAGRGRRVEPHHATPLVLQGRQHRRQQAQLTDAGVRQQQLGQHAGRPAATGQLRVELGKAAGHHCLLWTAQLMGAPQRGVECFRRLRPAQHWGGGGHQGRGEGRGK